MILGILEILFPIFFLIFLGWISGRKQIVHIDSSKGLASMIMLYGLPALLLKSTLGLDPKALLDKGQLLTWLIGYGLIFFITLFVFKFILKKEPKEGVLGAITTTFPNTAFMGIPIVIKLFGNGGYGAIVVSSIVVSVTAIPLTLVLMDVSSGDKKLSVKEILKVIIRALLKPLVIAPLLGLMLVLTGVKLPKVAMDTLVLVGDPTPALLLFTLGLTMSGFRISISKDIVWVVVLKNIVFTIIITLLAFAFGLKGDLLKETIILASLPPATICSTIAINYDKYVLETTSSTMIATLLSILSTGAVIYLMSFL